MEIQVCLWVLVGHVISFGAVIVDIDTISRNQFVTEGRHIPWKWGMLLKITNFYSH